MNRSSVIRFIGIPVAAIVVAIILPYLLTIYTVHVANVAMIFCLLAIGLFLSMGISGQFDLAQIAFFGMGAYTSAILILGDAGDTEFLRSKRWDLGELPSHRAMANLSVVAERPERMRQLLDVDVLAVLGGDAVVIEDLHDRASTPANSVSSPVTVSRQPKPSA